MVPEVGMEISLNFKKIWKSFRIKFTSKTGLLEIKIINIFQILLKVGNQKFCQRLFTKVVHDDNCIQRYETFV